MPGPELQEGVEQLDEERLVDLAAENALEDEIGLGIREYWSHGGILPQTDEPARHPLSARMPPWLLTALPIPPPRMR